MSDSSRNHKLTDKDQYHHHHHHHDIIKRKNFKDKRKCFDMMSVVVLMIMIAKIFIIVDGSKRLILVANAYQSFVLYNHFIQNRKLNVYRSSSSSSSRSDDGSIDSRIKSISASSFHNHHPIGFIRHRQGNNNHNILFMNPRDSNINGHNEEQSEQVSNIDDVEQELSKPNLQQQQQQQQHIDLNQDDTTQTTAKKQVQTFTPTNNTLSSITNNSSEDDSATKETLAVHNVGMAIVDGDKVFDLSKASDSILAIDPSNIEILSMADYLKENCLDQDSHGKSSPNDNYDDNDDDKNSGKEKNIVAAEKRQSSKSSITTSSDSTPSTSLSSTTKTKNDDVFPLPTQKSSDFVKMFRGSANYIANHRNKIVVYHIPGNLLEKDCFSELMDDIALTWLLGMKPVIVVGCREQIDARVYNSAKLQYQEERGNDNNDDDGGDHGGIVKLEKAKDRYMSSFWTVMEKPDGTKRLDSLRITDLQVLRIAMEEAGYVRFEIERQLGRSLRRNCGMSATREILEDGNVVSGNFFSAQPYGVIDGIDLMHTGFPRRVEVEKIKQVLGGGDVVLLTALGSSPSGEVFNVNSEFLASKVAGAIGASKLIYFTKEDIVFRNTATQKLVKNLRVSDAKKILGYHKVQVHPSKGHATIEDFNIYDDDLVDVLLKVGCSYAALENGVSRAHIIPPNDGALLEELYTRDGSGTLISRDIYEGIRHCDASDVSGIYDLIQPLVRAGTLVPRPKTVLEKDIYSYYVYTRDNLIVACAQLKLFEMGFAEIGCLVVNKDYRSQGRGDAILGFLERLSVQCGCSNVFVLSTQTMQWFVERGFKEVGVDSLPPSRKAIYNYQRKSKIYMKKIESDRDLDAAELWWS